MIHSPSAVMTRVTFHSTSMIFWLPRYPPPDYVLFGLSDALETALTSVVGRSRYWFRPLVRNRSRGLRYSDRAGAPRFDIPRQLSFAAGNGGVLGRLRLSPHLATSQGPGAGISNPGRDSRVLNICRRIKDVSGTIPDFAQCRIARRSLRIA